MKPVISVIVPVYNIALYLERCAASLLAQTYRDLEIILVDDGSTDASGAIADRLAAQHENIRVFHTPNGGVTKARLCGVRHASGEYIAFCDGDDTVEPEMYGRLMENMLKYHADISHCGYQMVFLDRVDYYYNTGLLAKQDNITALKELLCGSRIEPALCNKLFHKSLFHSLLHEDIMDYSLKENEDLLMNFWLFKAAATSVYEDFCPYHYMIRRNSASTGELSSHKLSDPIRVQQILLRETSGEPELQRILYGRLAAMYANGAEMASDESPALIVPHRRMCRKELWKLLPRVFAGHYGAAAVVHAAAAALCPRLSRLLHTVYSKKRGTFGRFDLSGKE